MPRPFSPRMFPHDVQVVQLVTTRGTVGGAARADGTATAHRANVQTAGMDKVDMVHATEEQAAGGVRTFDVSFVTDPGLVTGQKILWGSITLECLAPASPVFRGRAYRVRCVSRT